MIVISDTSPISNLIDLGQLSLLQSLFQSIILPLEVFEELNRNHDPVFVDSINQAISEGWIVVKTSQSNLIPETIDLAALDPGEIDAISLAIEVGADLLLIDERAGTKIANLLNVQTVGLLGVLLQAKESGKIFRIKPLLDSLREDIGFWVSESLYQKVLHMADEASMTE